MTSPKAPITTEPSPEDLETLRKNDLTRPSIPLISAPSFTGEKLDRSKNNYKSWCREVKEALGGSGLLRYTRKGASPPNADHEPRANSNWTENDERVCWFLASACSSAEKDQIEPHESDAAAYWEALRARHSVDSPLTQVYLIRDVFSMRVSEEESWSVTLTKAYDTLDRAWSMGTLDLEALKRIIAVSLFEENTEIQLPLMDRIDAATDKTPFSSAAARQFIEERERVFNSKKANAASIALSAQAKGKFGGCTNCRRPHHSAKYCISEGGGMAGKTLEESKAARAKDKAEGKAKASKPSTGAKAAVATTNDTPTALFTSLPSVPHSEIDPDTFDYEDAGYRCFATIAPVEDLPTDAPHRVSLDWAEYSREQALLSTDACPFYVDSGASTHISPNRNDFTSLRPIPARPIHGVGGSSISATAIGDIRLRMLNDQTLLLSNALFVPNATVRLISVSVITRTAKAIIHFDDTSCWITCKASNTVLARGTYLPSTQLYSINLAQPAACAHSAIISPTAETWHRRLGHANHQVVEDMARLKSGKGMPTSFSSKPTTCDSCIVGKQTKSPVPKLREEGGEHRAKRVLELLWVDLTGPMAVKSRTGNEYVMNIVDDYARKPFSIPLKKKSEASPQIRLWIVAQEAAKGVKVIKIRIDNGELTSKEFKAWAAEKGISIEYTAPYTSAHIGVVERMHRTLMGKQRAMRAYAKLPPNLWDELYLTSSFLTGKTITSSNGGKSPDELWFGKKPDLSFLREIGCRAFVLILNKHNPKLYERSIEMVLIGYDFDAKTYRCYNRSTKQVYSSYHVRFIESHEGDKSRDPLTSLESAELTIDSIAKGATSTPINYNDADEEEFLPEDPSVPIPVPEPAPPLPNEIPPVVPANDPVHVTPPQDPVDPVPDQPRRSSRTPKPRSDVDTRLEKAVAESSAAAEHVKAARQERRKNLADIREDNERNDPKLLDQRAVDQLCDEFKTLHIDQALTRENVHIILSAIASKSTIDPQELSFDDDPKSWAEAQRSDDAEKWLEGYKEELQSLKDMGVYKLIPRSSVPSGTPIRKGKPVFRAKRDENGVIARYKVRLVFKGFEQIFEKDYTSTTSPTARMESWRILLHIAAALGWDIQQIDVKTAFLYGLLPDNEIQYMEQPSGFEEPGKEDHVWVLQRALYGMKQAGRIWNQTLNDAMIGWGFTRLSSESCIYFRCLMTGIVIAAVHVDDFVSIADPPSENKRFKEQMETVWTISSLGEAKFVVGIAIARDRLTHTVQLSQTALIDKIVKMFGQSEAHPSSTPMEPGLKLRRPDTSSLSWQDKESLAKLPYRSLVGCLIYLTVGTRPDIAYAVQQLSQFLDNYSYAHWNAAIRVVRYLKGTRELKLTLGGPPTVNLIGFTDSDWANCLDTRRSVGGYAFSLGSGLISWSSRKQKTVATSSCEAEYTAAFEASKEAVWLRTLLSEIKHEQQQPTTILCDNKAAITLSKDPSLHNRSKHFQVKCHFLREKVRTGEIKTAYVNTKDNLADLFTKPLPPSQFIRFRSLTGLS